MVEKMRFLFFFRFALVLFFCVINLSGCAGAKIKKSNSASTPAHKLEYVKLAWVDNPGFDKVAVTNLYMNTLIDGQAKVASRKAQALRAIGDLSSLFRLHATDLLAKQLKIRGVENGEDIVLELTPFDARYDFTALYDARYLEIKVALKNAKSGSTMWGKTIQVYGVSSNTDDEMLSKFIDKCISELQDDGWLAEPPTRP